MFRGILDTIGTVLCRVNRGRRIRPAGAAVRVNLGAGLSVAPGWVNVDASLNAFLAGAPRWLLAAAHRFSGARRHYPRDRYVEVLSASRFVHHDLSFGIPLADASAECVYAAHVLEHLAPAAAARLAGEIHRVLKPGGVARICVPDLEHAVALYRQGRKAEAVSLIFADPSAGALSRHRGMYDFPMLAGLLSAAGLADVHRCRPRQGRCPDVALLDDGCAETLRVEAVRPSGGGPSGTPGQSLRSAEGSTR